MSATDLVARLVDVLSQLSIPYMLVGSYSSNYWGRPRSTRDADFVLILQPDQLTLVQQALGSDFQLDPQMSFESVTMTSRHVFTHRGTFFKIELFSLTDDPHDQSRFARRRSVPFEGRTAMVQTAEDVIIQKLRWFSRARRGKDLDDLTPVVQLQRDTLDLNYLRHWTSLHGTGELLAQLLEAAGGPPASGTSAT